MIYKRCRAKRHHPPRASYPPPFIYQPRQALTSTARVRAYPPVSAGTDSRIGYCLACGRLTEGVKNTQQLSPHPLNEQRPRCKNQKCTQIKPITNYTQEK